MELPERTYSYKSFCDELSKIDHFLPWLKIQYFVTYFDSWNSSGNMVNLDYLFKKNEFFIKSLGEIKKLTTTYKDPQTEEEIPLEFYAYLSPKNGILQCFTNAKTEEIDATLGQLKDEKGLHYLWISPSAFEEIKNTIFTAYPYGKIKFFSARSSPSSSFKGKIRPEYERSIEYHAVDGKESLEEFKYYYGVLPQTIEFEISEKARFRVNNKGRFTLLDGSLYFLLDVGQEATDIVLQIRRIVESSKFELVPIVTARKELQVPSLVPWSINFSRPLDYSDGEMLIQVLSKNKFTLFNHVLVKGSVGLDGAIADELKKNIFNISLVNQKMIVSPRYDVPTNFDSFLRFFETVVEHFDPWAVCNVQQGEA